MTTCDYGCGRVAEHQFKNGRRCCSSNVSGCPAVKSKIAESPHSANSGSFPKGHKPWNTGITPPSSFGQKIKEGMAKGKKSSGRASTPEREAERRRKISETAKINKRSGGYREGSGRCRGEWYDSPVAGRVFLDSSYEVVFAKYLDAKGIDWRKNKAKFPYEWDGKKSFYIPDFFLVESEEYVEIKGYRTERDMAKWSAFPHKHSVLYLPDLKDLGVM